MNKLIIVFFTAFLSLCSLCMEFKCFNWTHSSTNSYSNIVQTNNTDNESITTIKSSGTVKTKSIALEGIKQISVSGIGNLFIEQCKDPNNCTEALSITADDNILEYLKYTISDDSLELGIQHNASISLNNPISYHVTIKDINNITTCNNITVKSYDITTDQLDIESSGSGTIIIENINADKLVINSRNAAKFIIDGKVDEQVINVSGSGNYDASQLESKIAHIDISNRAKIHLNTMEKIKGYASGSSSVFYSGKYNPELSIETSNRAKIKKFC